MTTSDSSTRRLPAVIAIGGVLVLLLVVGTLLALRAEPTTAPAQATRLRPTQVGTMVQQLVPTDLARCTAYVAPAASPPQLRLTPLPSAQPIGNAPIGYYPVLEGRSAGITRWLYLVEPRGGQGVWLQATEVTLYGPCDDMLD